MATTMLRPEIATSWQRAAATGLAPADSPDVERVVDTDPDSRLRVAAAPVLDDPADEPRLPRCGRAT